MTINKTKLFTCIYFGAFLLAGAVRVINIFFFNISHIIGNFDVLIFIVLISGWAISLKIRLTDKHIRRLLISSAMLMIFWMVTRTIKYDSLIDNSFEKRLLWYLYYIPQIFIPLLLFLASNKIKTAKTIKSYKSLNLLFFPATVLFLGVSTNDLHQLTFRFKESLENWESEYTYGIWYYLVVIWIVSLILLSLALLMHKCSVSKSKSKIWIPLLFLAVGIVYCIWYYTVKNSDILKIYQLPEMICFVCIAIWESCIQIGLVPSNSDYVELFNSSSINAFITDNSCNVKYHSQNALNLSADVLKTSKESTALDSNTILRSHSITGGKVFWTENIADINAINTELEEIKAQIAEYNIILEAESKLKKRKAQIAEQNRLYNKITDIVMPQLNAIENAVKETESGNTDITKKYSEMCIYNAYIKRISNLVLISGNSETMSSFELENSIREMCEYLGTYGIKCSFVRNVNDELSSKVIILVFELFECIIEQIFKYANAALINLKIIEGNVLLKLNFDRVSEIKIPHNLQKRLNSLKGEISFQNVDETLFVKLIVDNGGALK